MVGCTMVYSIYIYRMQLIFIMSFFVVIYGLYENHLHPSTTLQVSKVIDREMQKITPLHTNMYDELHIRELIVICFDIRQMTSSG